MQDSRRTFARQFIVDAGQAYRSVLEISMRLARHFTDVQFVLRPHPFENADSYDELAGLPNVEVRQEGTSLEWISGARYADPSELFDRDRGDDAGSGAAEHGMVQYTRLAP